MVPTANLPPHLAFQLPTRFASDRLLTQSFQFQSLLVHPLVRRGVFARSNGTKSNVLRQSSHMIKYGPFRYLDNASVGMKSARLPSV